jgi:hypothetical protein
MSSPPHRRHSISPPRQAIRPGRVASRQARAASRTVHPGATQRPHKPHARVCGRCAPRFRPGPLRGLRGWAGRRAASVFPTSPPSQCREGEVGNTTALLCERERQQEEGGTGIWGEPRTPPSTPSGPVPGDPPRPPSCLPRTTTVPAAPMTMEGARTDGGHRTADGGRSKHDGSGRADYGEGARHRPRIPRRACRTRKLQRPGNPPTARGSPVPRTPSRPPPAQGRAARAMIDSHTAPTPAATETSTGPPTPRHRADPARAGAAGHPGEPSGPAGVPPGQHARPPARTPEDVPLAVPPGHGEGALSKSRSPRGSGRDPPRQGLP